MKSSLAETQAEPGGRSSPPEFRSPSPKSRRGSIMFHPWMSSTVTRPWRAAIAPTRRAFDYLREMVAVEPIAIHRDVDQRRRPKSRRKSARDVGGMKVVDLGIGDRARARLGAAAVRRNQEHGRIGRIGIDHLEP